jgi:hypothetical protein
LLTYNFGYLVITPNSADGLKVDQMEIDLGTLRLDARLLIKRLQNDLNDDWFPDPIKYADLLAGDALATQISQNFEANQGEYRPSKSTLFNVPKPNFTLRYGLETGLADRALYHGLTSFIIPFFDPLIPWNVFNHRYNNIRSDTKHTFRQGTTAWQDFIGATKSALTPGAWLLSTDVANCFEHIDVAQLKKQLLALLSNVSATAPEKSLIRAHIDVLFGCMQAWCYDSDHGLPQNRDASSFLANVYFFPVDLGISSHGFGDRYFRYMDDIKIVCRDEFEARRALKLLILELRNIGLYLNSKKTIITPATDEVRLKDCLNDISTELNQLDELWRTRSHSAITRALPRLRELTLKLIKEGKTDAREFRFCIHRLKSLALSSDFYVTPEFFRELTTAIIGCIEQFPASADKVAEYLIAVETTTSDLDRIADFLHNKNRCLYNWQNYWLWMTLMSKQYVNFALAAIAESLLSEPDDTPHRAGATLYLGAVGSDAAHEHIARNFRAVKSFLGQQNALIALQSVPFRPLIETHVSPHVRADLKGIYRALHKGERRYFKHPERLRLLEFPEPEIES